MHNNFVHLCTLPFVSSNGIFNTDFSSPADSNHSYADCNSLDSSHLRSQSGEDQLITEKMQKMNVGEGITKWI